MSHSCTLNGLPPSFAAMLGHGFQTLDFVTTTSLTDSEEFSESDSEPLLLCACRPTSVDRMLCCADGPGVLADAQPLFLTVPLTIGYLDVGILVLGSICQGCRWRVPHPLMFLAFCFYVWDFVGNTWITCEYYLCVGLLIIFFCLIKDRLYPRLQKKKCHIYLHRTLCLLRIWNMFLLVWTALFNQLCRLLLFDRFHFISIYPFFCIYICTMPRGTRAYIKDVLDVVVAHILVIQTCYCFSHSIFIHQQGGLLHSVHQLGTALE